MKITKKELINDLKSFKGKKQYYLSMFNNDIQCVLDTIEIEKEQKEQEKIKEKRGY